MSSIEFQGWDQILLQGAVITVLLVLAAVVLTLALGSIIARCQLLRNAAVRFVERAYSNVMRRAPELLVIYLVFFCGSKLAADIGTTLGVGRVELGSFASDAVVISLAYMVEALRGAFLNIPKGQFEVLIAAGAIYLVLNVLIAEGVRFFERSLFPDRRAS